MPDRVWLIVGVASLAVVGSAIGLYLKMSSRAELAPAASPHAAAPTPTPGAAPENAVPPKAVPSIEAAAEGLAQRLRASDGTGDEWALLARSYVQMRRYPEAVDAFTKALQKLPGDKALIDEQAAARQAAGDTAAKK